MCMKFCKKCCCMVIFAVLVGGVIYYLKSKDCNGNEKGSLLAEEAKAKREKLKEACGCVKDQTKDIASEVKYDILMAKKWGVGRNETSTSQSKNPSRTKANQSKSQFHYPKPE